MTKSYKMIVLHYMLSRGQDSWLNPVTPEQIAPYFHRYFSEKDYSIRTDFSDKQGKELRTYNEKKITSLLTPLPEHAQILYRWTEEICDYRLHAYFERKSNFIE
ncbi:hypothetical protein FQ087_09110 [Sporosarcina sp. ANT_H38]|uniref:hypothetical protein n=1 Tax=Sporosarcina sp. ANT_H38 TaxID=2597358 RepID=UPI0011F16E84|nr:hypothetical protein [Sporosarcina sp. ANT_H38]KAA0966371.1 hypothetical protein FQ087_09110 [Sporosarcina sp. ANT_H38]